MQLKTILLATLASLATASPIDSSHSNVLVARTGINVCSAKSSASTPCTTPSSKVYDQIAEAIRAQSDDKSCSSTSGSIDGVSYVYYAQGRHCNTTAEKKTVVAAMKEFTSALDSGKYCGTQCVKLNHGGTWDGYLSIGPTSTFNKDAYCGPLTVFTTCEKSGKVE